MPYLHPGEAFAIASAFSWALAVVLFKKCGESIAPLPLNLFKNTLALLFFVPALFLIGDGIPTPEASFIWVALSGIVGITLADTLFLSALNRLGAGLSAVVDCLYFPFMTISAIFIVKEEPGIELAIGGALVLGAILLGSRTRPIAGRTRRDLVIGIVLGSLGMAAMAVAIVSIKPFMVEGRILWIATARLLCGTIALVPILTWRREWGKAAKIFKPSPLWRLAVPASFIGTVLAMGSWIAGLTLSLVSHAAILNQLSTIFIFLLAAVILGEKITKRRAGAVALAFAGAAMVMWGG